MSLHHFPRLSGSDLDLMLLHRHNIAEFRPFFSTSCGLHLVIKVYYVSGTLIQMCTVESIVEECLIANLIPIRFLALLRVGTLKYLLDEFLAYLSLLSQLARHFRFCIRRKSGHRRLFQNRMIRRRILFEMACGALRRQHLSVLALRLFPHDVRHMLIGRSRRAKNRAERGIILRLHHPHDIFNLIFTFHGSINVNGYDFVVYRAILIGVRFKSG